MSRKRTIYSSALKTKVVLELLKNEQTLSQISSAYNVTPQNIKNWKKIFLANAEIAMEPSKAVKEYKEELAAVTEQNTQLTGCGFTILVFRHLKIGKLFHAYS